MVRTALEAAGDDFAGKEEALAALEAVLDLSLLERELIEDGARRRTLALVQVQEALSKLRVVDEVAKIVGCSLPTAHRRYHAGLTELRTRLAVSCKPTPTT